MALKKKCIFLINAPPAEEELHGGGGRIAGQWGCFERGKGLVWTARAEKQGVGYHREGPVSLGTEGRISRQKGIAGITFLREGGKNFAERSSKPRTSREGGEESKIQGKDPSGTMCDEVENMKPQSRESMAFGH